MGRWNERALQQAVVDEPFARIARALERAGSKVTEVKETGRAGVTLGSLYQYDCGCRRLYRVDQKTREESEHHRPCSAHKGLSSGQEQMALEAENPLTDEAESTTMEAHMGDDTDG